MLESYLRIGVRNILKHKGYSFLNILGLAIGIACCLVILLYVRAELSYDKYHKKSHRIYRVAEDVRSEGVGENSASMPFPFATAVLNDYPHLVENAVRFFDFQTPSLALENREQHKVFNEPRFFFADSTVFKMFDFEFLRGNPETALSQPNSLVLTRSMAQKYFGGEDPLGKVLQYEGQTDMQVTGVLEDVPANSHFQFDFLASFSSLRASFGGQLPRSFYWNPCWTYLLLPEGVAPETLEQQFPAMIQKYFPEFLKDKTTIYLQPLEDIHLYSNLDFEIAPNSNAAYVYIFSAIAVFVLIIACINFMNLATARAGKRGLEVGMRKALGALRPQLIKQFLGESTVMSALAGLAALAIVVAVLPAFNNFADKSLSATNLLDPVTLAAMLAVILFVGLAAGIYPAFFLSSFEPVKVLRGASQKGARGAAFRKVLVVLQFAISIILMIGTAVSYDQLRHLQSQRLGFNQEEVVLISIARTTPSRWYETFRSRVLQNPDVLNVTIAHDVPGAKYQTDNYLPEGSSDAEQMQVPVLWVGHDFLETFEMELLAGRNFSRDFPNDSLEAVIINEATVRHLGWQPEEAIGRRFGFQGRQDNQVAVRVVGVVRDFNYTSLHKPIGPFVLDFVNSRGFGDFFLRYVAVRIKPGAVRPTLAFLEQTWQEVVPQRAFEFSFLENDLDALYRAEENWGKIFTVFAFLAIFIACLGLFALASFTAELRTKEIGIRKVAGATVANIVFLLSREFIVLLAIASVIAWPVAFYVMNDWLKDFAYRTSIDPTSFALASLLAIAIALLTVSCQALKASLANPVKALKYE